MFKFFFLFFFIFSFTKAGSIYIYESTQCQISPILLLFSKNQHTKHLTTKVVNSRFVLNNNWQKYADLFVLPGGTASQYDMELGQHGREIIYNFIKNGGKGLFLCAGAYWVSAHTVFSQGTSIEKIVERSQFAIFEGKAQGPLIPYSYFNSKGAILWEVYSLSYRKLPALYFGGPIFISEHYHNLSSLFYYDQNMEKPAVIKITLQHGKAILSGIHFEESGQTSINDLNLQEILSKIRDFSQDILILQDCVMDALFSQHAMSAINI